MNDRASVSADGRYVAFASAASNLVPGQMSKGLQVLVRDLASGTHHAGQQR